MTTIHVITPVSDFSERHVESPQENISTEINTDSSTIILESERRRAERRESTRKEKFTNILLGRSVNKISLKYIFLEFGYLLVALISIVPFTLVPAHNLVQNPEYFYEIPLQFSHIPLILSAAFILNCSTWMNVTYVKTWINLFLMTVSGLIAEFICYATGHIVWTYVLNYQHPVPLNNYMYWYIIIGCIFNTLYFLFPKQMRSHGTFEKRLRYTILALMWQIQGVTFIHAVLAAVLLEFQSNYQWVIAIFLPLVPELCSWVILKIAKKASNGDMDTTEMTCSFSIKAWQALFQSYIIGSIATNATASIIVAYEFILSMYIILKIIWLNKKRPWEVKQQITLLQEYVFHEFLGFIVPLAFMICFLAAYFGPNGDILGDVRNSYWQYQAVENLNEYISQIGLLFFIDLCSLIVGSSLLWIFCGINLYRAYIILQEEFGYLLLANLTMAISSVRLIKLILFNLCMVY